MSKMDGALEATLAESHDDLNDELQSFGRAKVARLKYVEEQYKSRKLLRNGVYLSIPTDSPFRSKTKPYVSLEHETAPRPFQKNKYSGLHYLPTQARSTHDHRGSRSPA
jgi:hypothetical protein